MRPAPGAVHAYRLKDVERTAAALFRALGCNTELRIVASNRQHAVRVGLSLRLPTEQACFDTPELNRELYLWLTVLAAGEIELAAQNGHEAEAHASPGALAQWITHNRRATERTLARFPGWRQRYHDLCRALLRQEAYAAAKPAFDTNTLKAIRAALTLEAQTEKLAPDTDTALLPLVPLWLYPPAARSQSLSTAGDNTPARPAAQQAPHSTPSAKPRPTLIVTERSRQAQAEFIKLEGKGEDERTPEQARNPQARGREGATPEVRPVVEAELPATGHDDIVIADGIALPEWDFRQRLLRPDQCFVQEIIGGHDGGLPIPDHLKKSAQRLRQQFASLMPQRHWLRAQADGTEPDLDACVRAYADRMAGQPVSAGDLYLFQQRRERDLSCLVLADLSLSTDAWVTRQQRVIDVIRESLLLFAEALSATNDRFGLYGFSSHKREQVHFHRFKDFHAPYDALARGRIAAIRPGHYTRMGAAIRHAANLLDRQSSSLKLLLILSDGRPHDIDYYGERFGIEDTRMALIEARRRRIRPFCITIDREGSHYLPHLFGVNGYTVLRRPEELSEHLPLLYSQITGH